MPQQAIAAVLFTACTVGALTAVGCWFGALLATLKAAANRKPGVPYFQALNWIKTSLVGRNVYLDELFEPVGARWAKRSLYCMAGFIVSTLGTAGLIALGNAFFSN